MPIRRGHVPRETRIGRDRVARAHARTQARLGRTQRADEGDRTTRRELAPGGSRARPAVRAPAPAQMERAPKVRARRDRAMAPGRRLESSSGAGAEPGGPTMSSARGPRGPRAGRRSGTRRKATLTSTSYDEAAHEPFEPGWEGGSWYGPSSGTVSGRSTPRSTRTHESTDPSTRLAHDGPRGPGRRPSRLARPTPGPRAQAEPPRLAAVDRPAAHRSVTRGPAGGPRQRPPTSQALTNRARHAPPAPSSPVMRRGERRRLRRPLAQGRRRRSRPGPVGTGRRSPPGCSSGASPRSPGWSPSWARARTAIRRWPPSGSSCPLPPAGSPRSRSSCSGGRGRPDLRTARPADRGHIPAACPGPAPTRDPVPSMRGPSSRPRRPLGRRPGVPARPAGHGRRRLARDGVTGRSPAAASSTQAASEMFKRLIADGLVAQADGRDLHPHRPPVGPRPMPSSGATPCWNGCSPRSSASAGPSRTRRPRGCRARSRPGSRPASTTSSATPRRAPTATRSMPRRPAADPPASR